MSPSKEWESGSAHSSPLAGLGVEEMSTVDTCEWPGARGNTTPGNADATYGMLAGTTSASSDGLVEVASKVSVHPLMAGASVMLSVDSYANEAEENDNERLVGDTVVERADDSVGGSGCDS